MNQYPAPKSQRPRVLVESWSPVCDIQAFAEESATCVYFYLWVDPGTDHSRVRSCWVCNTQPAPKQPDRSAMDRGEAPMMPRSGCGHDPAGIRLDPDALSIQWLEEGDAAALLEGDRILALIPGWTVRGFNGYARYARGSAPFAWELAPAEPVLAPRVARSRDYWQAMAGGYWPPLQEQGLAALEQFFGPYESYYAIDGGKFPSKALVTGRRGDCRCGVTLGVSILCQPQVEQYWQDKSRDHRRIELAFAASAALPEDRWKGMLGWLAAQSGLPWRYLTWLGHGHTIPCQALPGFAAVLFVDPAELPGIPSPAYPPVMGEPVTVLWAVPVTAAEYDYAQDKSSPALLERYRGAVEELAVFTGEGKLL